MTTDCGASITAINCSPDDSLCVVGGRDLLKLYALARDDSALIERKNLRAGRKKTLDLSTSDLRWHPQHANVIATASTTGAVLLWDLTKPKCGGGDSAFRHERTVNRVAWHPSQGAWLLSCSQDASVRLWDTRCKPAEGTPTAGAVAVFGYHYGDGVSRSLAALQPGGNVWRGAAVAVRDVQFQPFHPFSFAAGGDDGTCTLWDLRRPGSTPHMAFSGHSGLVMSLQWHPTCPGVLATGGRDRLVQIWHVNGSGSVGSNEPEHGFIRVVAQRTAAIAAAAESEDGGFSEPVAGPEAAASEQEGARCIATVQTLAGVSRLAWRPVLASDVPVASDPAWGEDASSDGEREAAAAAYAARRPSEDDFQLATCAALLDRQVHVWDLRDAFVPAAVFSGHRDVVTGVAWVRGAGAGDAPAPWLVSGGKDGRLNVHNPARAQRPRRALCSAGFASSSGDLAWFGRTVDRDRYWRSDEEPEPGSGGAAATAVPPPPSSSAPFTVFSSNPLMLESAATRQPSALAAAAFDPPAHVFAVLALTYVTDGAPTHVLCACNAAVAERLGLVQTAQVWRVFEAAFAPEEGGGAVSGTAPAEGGAPASVPPQPPGPDRGGGSSETPRRTGAVGSLTEVVREGPSLRGSAVDASGSRVSPVSRGPLPRAVAASSALAPSAPAPFVAAAEGAGAEKAAAAPAPAAPTTCPAFHDSHSLRLRLGSLAAAAAASSAGGLFRRPAPPPPPSRAIPGAVVGLLEALDAAAAAEAAEVLRPDRTGALSVVIDPGPRGGRQRAASQLLAPLSRSLKRSPELGGVRPDRASAVADILLAAQGDAGPGDAPAPPLPLAAGRCGGGGLASPLPLPGALAPAAPPASGGAPPPATLAALSAAGWRAFWLETAVDVLRHYADRGDVQLCVTLARVLGVPVYEQKREGGGGGGGRWAPVLRGAIPRALMKAWLVQYINQLHRLQLWSPASTVIARGGDELVRTLNQLHTAIAAACSRCARDVAEAPPPPQAPPAPRFASAAKNEGLLSGGGGSAGSVDSCSSDDADEGGQVALPLGVGCGFAFAPCVSGIVVNGAAAPPASAAVLTEATACVGADSVSQSTPDAAAAAAAFQPIAAARCVGCRAAALACAVCSEPVRGAYVWCQGCGHGGHLAHMLGWFSRSSLCPTGCMHVCDLGGGAGGAVALPASGNESPQGRA